MPKIKMRRSFTPDWPPHMAGKGMALVSDCLCRLLLLQCRIALFRMVSDMHREPHSEGDQGNQSVPCQRSAGYRFNRGEAAKEFYGCISIDQPAWSQIIQNGQALWSAVLIF